MKITKKTYNENVRKFAKKSDGTWKNFKKLMKKLKLSDNQIDKVCEACDKFAILNCEIYKYAFKNDLNLDNFVCDIMNRTNA